MSASSARFRIGYLIKVPHQTFLDTAAKDPALEVVRMTLDDGVEAAVYPGLCHYCPQGHSHSVVNTGTEPLVILGIVPRAK